MKHTPGPWVADIGESVNIKDSNNNRLAMFSHTHLRGRRDVNEVYANAILCAAAPDLLKACRNVLNSLRDTEAFLSESPNTQVMVLNYLCNQVGAAIDKTEGK